MNAAPVDLHLHTTASDGRLSPAELVERVAAAGLAVMAVTDHDTIAAVRDVQEMARQRGIESISGIEITASDGNRDVHVLGYFVDPVSAGLTAFLSAAQASRVSRIEEIVSRLSALGLPVDRDAIVAAAPARSGRSLGRPLVARAMVAAGHVKNVSEAFERWLGPGGPAFVPRVAPSPEEVIGVIHAAGGLASLAHPGRTKIDTRIDALAAAGLDAIEVFHSDQDPSMVERYGAVARAHGLLVTGGSDYHGDPAYGVAPGSSGLPQREWSRLSEARHRHAVR